MSASSSLKPCGCKKEKDLSTEEGSQLTEGESDAVLSVSKDTARTSSSSAEPSMVLLVDMNPLDLPLHKVLVQAGGDPETGRTILIVLRHVLEVKQSLDHLYRLEREIDVRRNEMRRLRRRMVKPTQGVSKLWKVLDERRGNKEELNTFMEEWEIFEERVCELGKTLLDPKMFPKE